MQAQLFVDGISTNVRGEAHAISGFVEVSYVGYFTTKADKGSVLDMDKAHALKEALLTAHPKLAVHVQLLDKELS